MSTRLDVGTYVVLAAGVTVTEGLDEALCRVVGVEGALRDVRRVSAATGQLDGIEVRFLASELRPARPSLLRWHEALRLRSAVAVWRRAVADDDEDVDSLAAVVEAAEQLGDLVIDADPTELDELAVCGYVSDRDGSQVVEIGTTEATGRVRVLINEGVVYDGTPATDEPPGQHYDGPGWAMQEAEHCDDAQRPTGIKDLTDVVARIDPTKAQYAVAKLCALMGSKWDWELGTFNDIRDAIIPAVPNGCPSFFDQDRAAVAFWRNINSR